ncbi:MAG: carboxypeptidase-like regulatory domain-containing protein [Planctomycetota bacterium]
MRVVVVVALAVGAVALLLLSAADDNGGGMGRTHRDASKDAGGNSEPAERFSGGLRVIDGIARVPQDDVTGRANEATDTSGRFTWYGFAIRASNREAVAGVEVTVEQIGENGQRREFPQPKGRERGRFDATLNGVDEKAGDLRLILRSPDAEVAIVPLNVAAKRATTYLGNVVLTGESALAGLVVNERNEPVAGASVIVQQFGLLHPGKGILDRATTDSEGKFRFDRLPRGSFVVQGVAPDGRRLLRAPVVLPQQGTLVLPLMSGSDFRLRVYNTAGEPVTGAAISLVPQPADRDLEPLAHENLLRPAHATTDSDGLATIPQLPLGTYALFVRTADGAAYEDARPHVGSDEYRFFTWTLPTVPVALYKHPRPPAKPPKPPLPFANQRVRVHISGTSLYAPKQWRTVTTRTDAEGRLRIPRCGAHWLHVEVQGIDEKREGAATILLDRLRESDARHLGMMPGETSEPDEEEKAKDPGRAQTRVVRVVTADGVPVQGARVYVSPTDPRTTGDDGYAKLPAMPDDAVIHLARPSLASGDPAIELAGRNAIDLVWEEASTLVVTVHDSESGFPIDHRVKLRPRPTAWRRTGDGTFETRWMRTDPNEIQVAAPGFDAVTRVIHGDGPQYQLDVELFAPAIERTTLALEVARRGVPQVGVWVQGNAVSEPKAPPGHSTFRALTGAGGRIVVEGLRPGAWLLHADKDGVGYGLSRMTLTLGRNNVRMTVGLTPIIGGRVLDENGKPVADAIIDVVNSRSGRARPGMGRPPARTNAGGRFAFNIPIYRKLQLNCRASRPGFQFTEFTLDLRPGERSFTEIKLLRLARIDLPMRWRDGNSRAIPDGIVARIQTVVRNRWVDTEARAVSAKGRLVAEGVPPGRTRLLQLSGAAYFRSINLLCRPGRKTTNPTVTVHEAGVLRGKVVRRKRPVPGAVVYATSGRIAVARCNDQGEFVLPGMKAGRYRVTTPDQLPANRRKHERIEIAEGRETPVVLEVR